MTFNQWLSNQTTRRDPIGDLARDVKTDSEWPSRKTLAGLQSYLEKQHAGEGAIKALKAAWQEWQKTELTTI